MRPSVPGRLLLKLSERWFSADTRLRIIEPLLADWQHDVDSSPAGIRRALTWMRGLVGFWSAAMLCGLWPVARKPLAVSSSRCSSGVARPARVWRLRSRPNGFARDRFRS